MIFEETYSFRGKYAEKVKHLTSPIEPQLGNEFKIFQTYYDVYVCGAIFGYLYKTRGDYTEEDKTLEEEQADIRAEVFIKRGDECKALYRMIMLNEVIRGLSAEERVDNAFRYDSDEDKSRENMVIFNSYVLGGIKYLYSEFKDAKTREGCLSIMNRLVIEMKKYYDSQLKSKDDAA